MDQRGLPAHAAEDLAQEVAARAIQHHVRFAGPEDLLPWCLVVARNLVVDEHRKSSRLDIVAAVPDVAATTDVEREVIARRDVAQLSTLLLRLGEVDRTLLLEESPHRLTNAQYVRRHRLRKRLLRAIQGAALAWLWLRRRLTPPIDPVAATVALATIPFAAAAVLAPPPEAQEEQRPGAVAATLGEGEGLHPAADPRLTPAAPPSGATATALRRRAPHDEAAVRATSQNPIVHSWHRVAVDTPTGRASQEVGEGAEDAPLICVERDPMLEDWCWGDTSLPPGITPPEPPQLRD
jgi:hypothetical protein